LYLPEGCMTSEGTRCSKCGRPYYWAVIFDHAFHGDDPAAKEAEQRAEVRFAEIARQDICPDCAGEYERAFMTQWTNAQAKWVGNVGDPIKRTPVDTVSQDERMRAGIEAQKQKGR